MAKIAYNNIDNKLNGLKDAQKVRNLLKIQQLGSQLLNFKMLSNSQKCKVLQDYCDYETKNE